MYMYKLNNKPKGTKVLLVDKKNMPYSEKGACIPTLFSTQDAKTQSPVPLFRF